MTPPLYLDFESRSTLELRDVGLWNYSRHPSTDVWCAAVAIGENEPFMASLNAPHAAWLDMVRDGATVVAHNAAFELAIWNQIMTKRYGWPALKPEQTVCTLATAYAMGLPGSLEDAAMALGLEHRKDAEGHAVMLRYARPWKMDPLRWMDENPKFKVAGVQYNGQSGLQRLYRYCMQDVRAGRDVHKRVMPLSDSERRVWLMDYRINQRGVQIDIPSAKAAVILAEQLKAEYDGRMSVLTDGRVQTCTALIPMKQLLTELGALDDGDDALAKQDVTDLLDDLKDSHNPNAVLASKILVLRQEAGKASAAKFDVMCNMAGDDGRLRNMYAYHGAATGRWAGRGVQVHNLVRDMPPAEVVEMVLELVRSGDSRMIDVVYGPPLSMLTRSLRSFFVAPEGKRLVGGDFSNIEGRGQAWFAGEQWKLDAFVAADEKRGPGLYELAYSRMFHVPVESVKNPSEERQVGKVSELAFGYQGGVGSFHTMSKNYGVKASDEKADEFKDAWRDAHPAIAGVRGYSERTGRMYRIGGVWRAIQDAALSAVRAPGEAFKCGYPGREATFKKVGSFLWALLPGGRAICFAYPKILESDFGPQLTYMAVPSEEDRRKGKIIHDPSNGPRWVRMGTYGGSLFNNIVQGFCADIQREKMLALDDAGMQIVLHTHDDINGEVDSAKAELARDAMQEIMAAPLSWTAGFPIHAKCMVMKRYGK